MKKGAPPIVKLIITVVITVVIWIAFETYRTFTIKPPPDVPPEILRELNPVLDSDSLNDIANRIYLNENEIEDTVILLQEESPQETDEEVPEEIQDLLNLGQQEQSEETTQSGELQNEQ